MGTVRTDLVHFCPIDDDATLEAIAAHIELKIRLESSLNIQIMNYEEEW